MNKTISRRSFFQLKKSSRDRIIHIDPEWPTPQMAKIELENLESDPFIFKLPIPEEKPKKLNTKTLRKRQPEKLIPWIHLWTLLGIL